MRHALKDVQRACEDDKAAIGYLNFSRSVASRAVDSNGKNFDDRAVIDLILMGALFQSTLFIRDGRFRPLLPELWSRLCSVADKINHMPNIADRFEELDDLVKALLPTRFSVLIDKDHREMLKRYQEIQPRVYLSSPA